MCKKIHRGGNAEQYHADKKYKEAVAEAVEACADDTKGQTCYICTQALHWKTKEGLVRMCSCRGTAGFAHVSCLAEQAKILLAEVEENNLGLEKMKAAIMRWETCSLCKQDHRGVVKCALGWAIWKTYLGRPETDPARRVAMHQLAMGLDEANKTNEGLEILRAEVAMIERVCPNNTDALLTCKGNIAFCCARLGQKEEALALRREIYATTKATIGPQDPRTIRIALNLACSLREVNLAECMSLVRETMPIAKQVFGADSDLHLRFRLDLWRLHHKRRNQLVPR